MLEITPDASAKDIKRAYRKLAMRFHPDVNKESLAYEAFLLINEAYTVLSDNEARRKYDINMKYGFDMHEITVKENKYTQGNGKKYGTAYKYPNQPKRPSRNRENLEPTNNIINHVTFYFMLLVGLYAIIISAKNLLANGTDDKYSINGLAFGLCFTILLIYGFWFYYFKNKE